MLINLDTGKPITSVPHKKEFGVWKNRLSDIQYEAIRNNLIERIQTGKVHTSSWIPGSDWSNTVFEPIYSVACCQNQESAAKFFGLILWDVLMQDENSWSFGRYEKDGIPIQGLTYFRFEGE
ncbi:hypothetical protein [Leptospira alexanderi]|uniref:hypothetical protein n=1 Tax=Leptospira alexanderi TaxID=100053 RepID=UPI000990A616|nr:hypothetical protein [Leptospira alexanderi]